MHLEIVRPDKKVFKGEVDYVYCPGLHGAFGILNNHAPIIATLKSGTVKIRVANSGAERFDDEVGKIVHDTEAGAELLFSIGGGVVEVLNNKVVLLAE